MTTDPITPVDLDRLDALSRCLTDDPPGYWCPGCKKIATRCGCAELLADAYPAISSELRVLRAKVELSSVFCREQDQLAAQVHALRAELKHSRRRSSTVEHPLCKEDEAGSIPADGTSPRSSTEEHGDSNATVEGSNPSGDTTFEEWSERLRALMVDWKVAGFVDCSAQWDALQDHLAATLPRLRARIANQREQIKALDRVRLDLMSSGHLRAGRLRQHRQTIRRAAAEKESQLRNQGEIIAALRAENDRLRAVRDAAEACDNATYHADSCEMSCLGDRCTCGRDELRAALDDAKDGA